MPDTMEDASVVIPVLNEDHKVLRDMEKKLKSLGAEVIIVDDGSSKPYKNAAKHGKNLGYGASLMTGIRKASRDIIITADGDGQHTVKEIHKIYKAFKLIEKADMVIGARRVKNESFVRFVGRKFLNWTASLLCTYWVSDLNSGLRVFKRDIAIGYFPILCATFSFTTSLTISMMSDKYRVEFFPINIESRASGSSHVKVVRDGFITLYYIFRNSFALRTRGIRKWLRSL